MLLFQGVECRLLRTKRVFFFIPIFFPRTTKSLLDYRPRQTLRHSARVFVGVCKIAKWVGYSTGWQSIRVDWRLRYSASSLGTADN